MQKFKIKILFTLVFSFFVIFFLIIPSVFIIYFGLFSSNSITNNLLTLNKAFLSASLLSCLLSSLTTIISIFLGACLAFLLYDTKSSIVPVLIILISTPLWSNYLIKLIGLKSLFDIINGASNSTYGWWYTLIGLIYIFFPLATITIHNTLNNISKNVILASRDLGRNKLETIFFIIFPYIKNSIFACISLIFFPSFFSLGVNEFLNNTVSNQTISEWLLILLPDIYNTSTKNLLFFWTIIISLLLIIFYFVKKIILKIIFYKRK